MPLAVCSVSRFSVLRLRPCSCNPLTLKVPPVLVQSLAPEGETFIWPPLTTMAPVLAKVDEPMVSVPAVAFSVPLLLNVTGLMLIACAAVLAVITPPLVMVAALLLLSAP